jgi:hypothetical protein
MDAPFEKPDRPHIVPSAASAKRRFSLDWPGEMPDLGWRGFLPDEICF